MHVPDEIDELVQTCIPAAANHDHETVKSALQSLVGDRTFAERMPAFDPVSPTPRGWLLGGEYVVHRSPGLTVMVLDTLPGVLQPPHDHQMVAIIGVFDGVEEQRFYTKATNGVVPTVERTLEAGEVIVLGERAVHAISAPPERPARAVHVYFGDIYDIERHLFHPETLDAFAYSAERYDEFCRVDPRVGEHRSSR